MKKRKPYMTSCQDLSGHSGRNAERGATLLIVIVLSTIVLAVMTTLIYMITVGTQISGPTKRYLTLRDAAYGGWEITRQLVALQGEPANQDAFLGSLNASPYNLASLVTTPTGSGGCTGTTEGGKQLSGMQAKLLTRPATWSSLCDASLTIDPKTVDTYDFTMKLGSGTTKYNVYAKVANTVVGNSAGESSSSLYDISGVVYRNSGMIEVLPMPYVYTIEVDAENASNPAERVRLSILYQN
jgi:hypothetical protein